MVHPANASHRLRVSATRLSFGSMILAVVACTQNAATNNPSAAMQTGDARMAQVAAGRYAVIHHDCGGCHGGGADPSSKLWLSGDRTPNGEFHIGPFTTRPRNLTPDNQTGLGRFTDRQIFNALRFGLRPGETPDVEITSIVPGQGNFPLHPRYLAIPMPWPSWRHMPDKELWAIAAYLKDGLKPVNHLVKDSEGPPDFWASMYTVDSIGPYPAVAFPAASERAH